MDRKVYLDGHIVSRPSAKVIAGMNDYFREKWHRGDEKNDLKSLYALLGATNAHFILTSGGTEATFQLLINFYLEEIRETGRNHLLTSSIEEATIVLSFSRMEQLGCVAELLPVDEKGCLNLDALDEALKLKTSLISLSWANPLTGVIQPISEMIRRCHAKNTKVHINASHVVGKLPISFDELGMDFLSFDGDKIHTPQGIGGIVQRAKPKESIGNGAALGSLSLAVEEQMQHFALETARLRDTFEAELCYALPDTVRLFQEADRLPHISCLAFPGVMSEALLYTLDRQGIFASIGGGQFQKLSSQLKSCGLAPEIYHSAMSFAISHETTEDDLAHALDVIVSSVRQLANLSACL